MSISFAIDTSSDLSLELSVTASLCQVVNTPRAVGVFMLIKYKQYAELANLSIDPANYLDHQHFADDYLVTELLRKSANLPLEIDRANVALQGFLESEDRCRSKNCAEFDDLFISDERVRRAKRYVHSILGRLNREDLQFVEANFGFGPGATTGVKGVGSVMSDKFDRPMHLTESLYPFYKAVLGEHWHSCQSKPKIVEGNRFTTVPKSAKTDRGICVEPTLNIFVQKGVGKLLRKRLLRAGVDLSSQCKNQTLASLAFANGLATIDLSSASDSIAWRLVLNILPHDWLELLDLCRSPSVQLPGGRTQELEKFSSMGNGYTFELESLIFYAVCLACVPPEYHEWVNVYGDDIIVPARYARSVIEVLDILGFSTNERKSFLAGCFFESCGTDWFQGHEVRPFYLHREDEDKQIPYTLQIANALRLYAQRRGGRRGCDIRFKHVWRRLVKLTPSAWSRCKVPPSWGDTGIITSFNEAKPRKAWDSREPKFEGPSQAEGYLVRHVVLNPRQIRKDTAGLELCAEWDCSRRPRVNLWARELEPLFTYINWSRYGSIGERPIISSESIKVIQDMGSGAKPPTYGREPRKGLFGKPLTKMGHVVSWPDGLDWV